MTNDVMLHVQYFEVVLLGVSCLLMIVLVFWLMYLIGETRKGNAAIVAAIQHLHASTRRPIPTHRAMPR